MKFLGMSWQNFAKNLFYTGRYDLPNIVIQQLVEILTAVTRKPLTVWSRLTDHQKVGRVAQVFVVQLQNKIPREQFCFRFLLTIVYFYTEFRICFMSV
jgi:hypothetical protein